MQTQWEANVFLQFFLKTLYIDVTVVIAFTPIMDIFYISRSFQDWRFLNMNSSRVTHETVSTVYQDVEKNRKLIITKESHHVIVCKKKTKNPTTPLLIDTKAQIPCLNNKLFLLAKKKLLNFPSWH